MLIRPNVRTAGGRKYDNKDVKVFMGAEGDRRFAKLLGEYSNAHAPLFGLSEHSITNFDLVTMELRESDPNTIEDCRNLSELLRTGARLYDLASGRGLDYDAIEKAGLVVHERMGEPETVEMTVRLDASEETLRFLRQGIESVPPGLCQIALRESPDSTEAAIEMYCIDVGELADAQSICAQMLECLSMVMIHDVTMGVKGAMVTLASHSVASSLWCAMLEAARGGRVVYCESCGAPFIAVSERKDKAVTCSDRCRQRRRRSNHKE